VADKLPHLNRGSTGDDGFASPLQCLVHVWCFENPEAAYVLLGFEVWAVGGEDFAVGLCSQGLRGAGRGEATGEESRAGSGHLFVEHVDVADHGFAFE